MLNNKALLNYYKKYKPPFLSVDAIVLNNQNEILLMKRKIEPFKGLWGVTGGHVEYGETAEKAILREVREETGLRCKIVRLLGVYSSLKRDPRYHTVSIAYLLTILGGKLKNSFESSEQRFFPLNKVPKKLGFDHNKIISDYKSTMI